MDQVRGDPLNLDPADVDDPWANLRVRPKEDPQVKNERKRKLVTDASIERQRRMVIILDAMKGGALLREALDAAQVTMPTYSKWRQRFPHFAADIDIARAGRDDANDIWNGSHASFALRYFGMAYGPHHLAFINAFEEAPMGTITMGLMPPDHGKTTMSENDITEAFARDPQYRVTIASANLRIAKKILGRIKNRLEPTGPFPDFVREWGPFVPQTGNSRSSKSSQPWTDSYFNVYKKKDTDERDYSCQALGYKSEIVSTRCDRLHIDDLQSLKNAGKTEVAVDDMAQWIRQDALSRPGQYGKTSIVGTRVKSGDIYEVLENDANLDGILRVIKFPAIITDHTTGEPRALWPERYTLEQLDRQRRIVGEEAWDRNYMQNPGASDTNATFSTEIIDAAKHIGYSLKQPIGKHGAEQFVNRVVYVGLDPAIGAKNCVIACEVDPAGRLIIRRISERINLRRNEDIMVELGTVVMKCNLTGMVTDVVIESMNFQRGLARDERLMELQREHGFAVREHLTGWNKYDDDIGVASMVTSFMRGEIIIPWADDDETRHEMGELCRQLRAWRPGQRGNKLRQDRVMALWFVWILWRQRWKQARSAIDGATSFKRNAVPSIVARPPLLIPIGASL